jgi:hypothetical protein
MKSRAMKHQSSETSRVRSKKIKDKNSLNFMKIMKNIS